MHKLPELVSRIDSRKVLMKSHPEEHPGIASQKSVHVMPPCGACIQEQPP
jgi:hypothetical protein